MKDRYELIFKSILGEKNVCLDEREEALCLYENYIDYLCGYGYMLYHESKNYDDNKVLVFEKLCLWEKDSHQKMEVTFRKLG